MPYRLHRALMLWFALVLQTMTPFIHAHAGSVQLNHGGFLHMHQGVQVDTAYPMASGGEQGAEVDVAQGMPLGPVALDVADAAPQFRVSIILSSVATASRPGVGLPAPPSLQLSPSDYALPHALAPPFAD